MVLHGKHEGDRKAEHHARRLMTRRWWPALAISAVFAAAGFAEWQNTRSHQAPSHNREQAAQTPNRGGVGTENAADSLANENSGTEGREGHWYDTDVKYPTEWLLVFIAAVQALILWRQTRIFGRQTEIIEATALR
jgi:hypothetical protein